MKPNSGLAGAVLAAAVTLSGCSMAPHLTIPDVPTAAVYKETGPWMPAQPADGLSRGDWWKQYGDAELNALPGTPDPMKRNIFIGLIVVMPVLGHATWHLYRKVVAP